MQQDEFDKYLKEQDAKKIVNHEPQEKPQSYRLVPDAKQYVKDTLASRPVIT